MSLKTTNKSILVLFLLLILGFLHTLPLWNLRENLAAGYGDPLAHAGIGSWYCSNVLGGHSQSQQFLTPIGADMAGAYDSPFPFVLTCPFYNNGSLFQFHLFTLFQIWLVLIGAWLVATHFIKSPLRQFAYVLFVWWCGFYVSRSHQHVTLLSMIWGVQFLFYAFMNLRPRDLKNVLGCGLLVGLSLVGTFQNIPALFLLGPALLGYRIWQSPREFVERKAILNLLSGLLVTLGIFLLMWWPMIRYTMEFGPVAVDDQRRLYNLDVLSLLIPPEFNIVFEWFPGLPKFPLEQQNTLDLFIVFLLAVSVFTKKFWKDSFRVLLLVVGGVYLVLSLGPELRVGNEVVSYLDFNTELFRYFPLRITRTPGRLALLTNLCFILMAFIFVEKLEKENLKKFLSYFLVVWAFVAGLWMNRLWFFPTMRYTDILPISALSEVRNMPPETIVVNVPTAWAQDPSQNFLQIFHNKNITSGYLAYTNYNQKVIQAFAQEPFLGKLGCDGEVTAFQPTQLMTQGEELRRYMHEHNYKVVIINKTLLLNNPACKNLTAWVQFFAKQPWVRSLEENNLFVVAVVQ